MIDIVTAEQKYGGVSCIWAHQSAVSLQMRVLQFPCLPTDAPEKVRAVT